MTQLPRPRCVPGQRAILHADGDPWNGCVVYISAYHTSHLFRCTLPAKQRPRVPYGHRSKPRIISASDLF